MKTRSLLFLTPAASVALALAPTAAHADLIPAPPAQASGVAVQVGSLLDVSRTDASAGSGAPTASASVLRLQGQPVLNLGGSQSGDGETGGSLLDTAGALPARAQVAPWHAAAEGSRSPVRHARSSAAVARVDLPSVVGASVLSSSSDATYTDQKSTGTAVSDGADVTMLDALRLNLLHSEVRTDGQGHSYLVGLNGTEIGTDAQLGASPLCSLAAPGLLNLSCLTASGGAGSGMANVLDVDPLLGGVAGLNPVAAFTAASSSGVGSAAPVTEPAPVVNGDETTRGVTSPAPIETAGQNLGSTTGRLPRTGSSPLPLLATALTALVGGLGLRRVRPVRR